MKPSVSIVGAGRVGRALGRLLHDRGWKIDAVITRSRRSARAAAAAIGAGSPSAILPATVANSGTVLIATPDDAIPRVTAELAALAKHHLRDLVVLHTSGALDHTALAAMARYGAFTGSIHPLQTFTLRGSPNLKGIAFAIEGNPRARQMARRITRDLGGIPVRIASGWKPAYHAAGALAAGHALALIEAAVQILIRCGFTRQRAVNALLPLTRQMLDNFGRFGPRAAWTGPLARGDYATIEKHIAALRGMPQEFLDAYRALSRLAARTLSVRPEPLLRRLDDAKKQSTRRNR
jgi:predicted short-subunit dehydrogenase-like oxidoreductase (DUF2520 family)